MWITVAKVFSLALTIIGIVLAIVFFIAATPTHWSCGYTCGAFNALLLLSCLLAGVGGILMLVTWKRRDPPAK